MVASSVRRRLRGGYEISDDAQRFDAEAMHDFLEAEGYWAKGRSREATLIGAAHSVVLGVYAPDGAMVGGARLVTDWATFGWLTDVYVVEAHRGRGLGKALVAAAREHPSVATVKRLLLITSDAHELYHQYGFAPVTHPDRWLELRGSQGMGTEDSGADPAGASAAATADAGRHDDSSTMVARFESAGSVTTLAPDPRTASASLIADHLLPIIEREGPITVDRAFRLYIKASGSSKVTKKARVPLEQALWRLDLRGQLDRDEIARGDDKDKQAVIRLSGTPAVIVRELGDRSLYDVPLNEVVELMRRVRRGLQGPGGGQALSPYVAAVVSRSGSGGLGSEQLKRAVLATYGLTRMTQAANRYLSEALQLLEDD